jgi:hypothetical protein
MPELREFLADLFIEVARVEHLARTRVERKYVEGLAVLQYGILAHLVRSATSADSVAGIAWSFQEDESRILDNVGKLAELGYVKVIASLQPHDAIVEITRVGRDAQVSALERMAPDFMQIVSEIPEADILTAHKVLREIRLVMDNLPDR